MALARFSLRLARTGSRLPTLLFKSPNLRMFTTTNIMSKEQIEELQKNPYFDKYADKIAKLQKTSPEEFLNRLAEKEAKKQSLSLKPNDFFLPTAPKTSSKTVMGHDKEKFLEKIMKTELLADKTSEEISLIWGEHWSTKDAVAAVIPVKTFDLMQKRFKEYNTFLFPLPRDQGYEFVVVQFLGKEAHFTTLINFQAHKENAPECLSMVHYTELAGEKGIVLMVGEYDKDVLSAGQARSLVAQTVQYYGLARAEDKKLAHLARFTHQTEEFNHLDLVLELETDFPPPPA